VPRTPVLRSSGCEITSLSLYLRAAACESSRGRHPLRSELPKSLSPSATGARTTSSRDHETPNRFRALYSSSECPPARPHPVASRHPSVSPRPARGQPARSQLVPGDLVACTPASRSESARPTSDAKLRVQIANESRATGDESERGRPGCVIDRCAEQVGHWRSLQAPVNLSWAVHRLAGDNHVRAPWSEATSSSRSSDRSDRVPREHLSHAAVAAQGQRSDPRIRPKI